MKDLLHCRPSFSGLAVVQRPLARVRHGPPILRHRIGCAGSGGDKVRALVVPGCEQDRLRHAARTSSPSAASPHRPDLPGQRPSELAILPATTRMKSSAISPVSRGDAGKRVARLAVHILGQLQDHFQPRRNLDAGNRLVTRGQATAGREDQWVRTRSHRPRCPATMSSPAALAAVTPPGIWLSQRTGVPRRQPDPVGLHLATPARARSRWV